MRETFKKSGHQTGAAFQNLINQVNDEYERLGLACVTRKAIPGKYLGYSTTQRVVNITGNRISASDFKSLTRSPQSTRKFVPESKAEPDYGGTIAPHGRAIFYDAKATARERLDFDNLHAHQIDYLARAAKFGAVAGFLVQFSAHNEVYFLPIQTVSEWRTLQKTKSIPRAFFQANFQSAPSGKGRLFFDYLSVV